MTAIFLRDTSMAFMATPNPDLTDPGPTGMGGAMVALMRDLLDRTPRNERWQRNSVCFDKRTPNSLVNGASLVGREQPRAKGIYIIGD
jgi:hypothetical protein